MTPKLILALILTAAVLAAWVRLILWRRGAPAFPLWRFVVLIGVQPVWAALLFLGLFPPALPVAGGTLTVLTANAPRTAAASGGQSVALPEVAVPGVERVPDLGTALRLYPDVRRIRVLGDGLTARDRDAAGGLAVDFTPTAPRPGLISLTPPARIAPGMRFQTGGQVAGLPGAVVDLVDPAGRVTDSQAVDAEGRFTVSGTARAAGLVTFGVRVKDGQRVVEQADVPVRIEADAKPRLLILAGAPGPEVKYLRRWATDAGFTVNTQMSAGGGVQLGDPAIAINAATLRQFDVAVIDDRSWPGARPAVLAAVRDGLGLVLRASGPLDGAGRASWRSLGFALTGPDVLSPIALPAATDAAVARTRSGIGSADAPADAEMGEPFIPELSRLAAIPGGADAVPLIRDAGGATLSAWRAVGLGRVAVFTGVDSYGLTLTGHGALYGDWWSGMLAAVARPSAGAPVVTGPAWVGDRLTLCNLSANARVQSPNGAAATLIPDPAAGGCAGLWPAASGWHLLRTTDARGAEQISPLYVQPADRLLGIKAARDRDATLMLGRKPTPAAASGEVRTQPGPSWPWLLAWLLLGGGLWWFERSNLGRAVPKTDQ
ncbi:carboxypeptidase regulatory-like domain-containing protein [Brevundimonas goettingensis]|uniref:Carboxypeptidase regulatory-like domain-containing protein n=1 Tax=Brevundimonas goettingensis TaxID=2774190 RepID=A0A975C7A7_9CAUL|nr:carboxypeptidase regulatory-like domain-containing protein [Brevundimonas goettingensis]